MFCDDLVPHFLSIVPNRAVVAKILEKSSCRLVLRISKNAQNMQFFNGVKIYFLKKFNFCIPSSGMILGYIMVTFMLLESSYHQVDYCNCEYVHTSMCAIFETQTDSMGCVLQSDSWILGYFEENHEKYSHSIFCRFKLFSFW